MDDKLPESHAPTVPLPPEEKPAVSTVPATPAPSVVPTPEEISKPGEESPDLAEAVSVWPTTKETLPETTDTVIPTPPDVSTSEPVLETGPKVPPHINSKKILMFGGIIVVVLILILVGYGWIRSMMTAPIGVSNEENVNETTESTSSDQQMMEDESSLRFLDNYFDGVGDLVKTLEEDVKFKSSLQLRPNQL